MNHTCANTILALAAAALLAAGCSGRERVVAEPLDMVAAKLSMMPEQSDAMTFANQMAGAAVYLEPQGETLVWHFTKDGADYCRFTAQLIAAGPNKTRVITRAEDAPQASQAAVAEGGKPADYSYLCGVARIAGDESIAATLENRPANRQQIHSRLRGHLASNPAGAMNAADAAIEDAMREQGPPEDPCENPQSQKCKDWDSLQAARAADRAEFEAQQAERAKSGGVYGLR